MKKHEWLIALGVAISLVGCSSEVTTFDACPVPGPEVLFSHLGDSSVSVASHDDFAWFGSSGGIYSVDLRINQPLLLATVGAVGLAANATDVYALSNAGDITAIDRNTGAKRVFGDSSVIGSVESMTVDGGWLYAGGPMGLSRVSLADQSIEVIAPDLNLDHVDSIAVDSQGRVFFLWHNKDNTRNGISSVSPGDPAVLELVTMDQGSGADTGTRTLAVDDAYVYWVSNWTTGDIARVAKRGGSVETIGTNGGLVRGLTVSHGTVFTSGTHGIQRSRLDHGPMDTVLEAIGSSPIEVTNAGLVFAAGPQAFLVCRPVE